MAETDKAKMSAEVVVRDGLVPAAVKIGSGVFARWFAIDAVQSIYVESTWEADVPIELRKGCVKAATMGDKYGTIIACFATMAEAHAAADHYARLVWGIDLDSTCRQ